MSKGQVSATEQVVKSKQDLSHCSSAHRGLATAAYYQQAQGNHMYQANASKHSCPFEIAQRLCQPVGSWGASALQCTTASSRLVFHGRFVQLELRPSNICIQNMNASQPPEAPLATRTVGLSETDGKSDSPCSSLVAVAERRTLSGFLPPNPKTSCCNLRLS